MWPWRLLIGAIGGAIVVKESKNVDRLYDSVRQKIVKALKRPQVPIKVDCSPVGPRS